MTQNPAVAALLIALAATTPATAAGNDTMDKAGKATGGLPASVGAWTAAEAPRRIEAATIFDYMNGGGELYLGYRFEHLDVTDYQATDGPQIVVEVYSMTDADDPWGLMSEDWSGEAIALGGVDAQSRCALYGAGLLRLACGTTFARVMAYEETEASRAAVLEIGAALAADCMAPPRPAVVQVVPEAAGELKLKADKVRFLRSPLVLNSAYFVASGNPLGLDDKVEAVIAEYRPEGGDHTTKVHLVLARYADAASATAAVSGFKEAYLAEPLETSDPDPDGYETTRIEDGWVGLAHHDRDLMIVFEADTPAAAIELMTAAASGTEKAP